MRFLRDKKGVTLLELMVVVAIVGMTVTMAIPAYYTWIPKYRVNQATLQLSDDLQYARGRSISENIPWVVLINLAGNSYSVYRDPTNSFDPNSLNSSNLVKTVALADISSSIAFGYNVDKDIYGSTLSSGVNAQFSNSQLSGTYHYEKFLPDGTAQFDGTIYLIPLQDLTSQRYDRCRAVSVTGLSGFIKTWQHDYTKSGSWQ